MCVALGMGNMIGSGVFLLPRDLAPLGWNAVIGWGVSIAGTLCLAVAFARHRSEVNARRLFIASIIYLPLLWILLAMGKQWH